MPRYFFDTRDNETFIPDDVGVEIATLDEVKLEASRSMADLAKDVSAGFRDPHALNRGAGRFGTSTPAGASL